MSFPLRDALGRIVQRDESMNTKSNALDTPAASSSSSHEYVYDSSNRLYQVLDKNNSDQVVEQYTYDEANNRQTFHRYNGSALALVQSGFTYNEQDQLEEYYDHDAGSSVTLRYDLEGNLSTKTVEDSGEVTKFGYDYLGRLTQVILDYQGSSEEVVDYKLDAAGRRVAKTVTVTATQVTTTEKYLYNGFLHPSVVMDGNDTPKAFFMGNIMLKVNPGNDDDRYRLVRDYLGSVRSVINIDTGDIAQRLEYDSYGNVLTDTNEGFQPFGYGGGIYDHDTGLTKFGFRDYDPVVGRWTTKDPIGLSGGLNVYEYGASNPVRFIDPVGLEIIPVNPNMVTDLPPLPEGQRWGSIHPEYGIPYIPYAGTSRRDIMEREGISLGNYVNNYGYFQCWGFALQRNFSKDDKYYGERIDPDFSPIINSDPNIKIEPSGNRKILRDLIDNNTAIPWSEEVSATLNEGDVIIYGDSKHAGVYLGHGEVRSKNGPHDIILDHNIDQGYPGWGDPAHVLRECDVPEP